MRSVFSAATTWLDSHQYLALWLEGIALLAIFIWDRIEASQQHKQTLAQMEITQNQARATETAANAATKSAEALIASERAWVMVTLERQNSGFITDGVSQEVGTTSVAVLCKYMNQGKTPARLSMIEANLVILDSVDSLESLPQKPNLSAMPAQIFIPRALISNEYGRQAIHVAIRESRGVGRIMIFYGVLRYRHLFSDKEVTTTFGYEITPADQLLRLVEHPEYNENT